MMRRRSQEENMDRSSQVAEAGDIVVITGHRVGEHEQTGEILEVLGESPREHFRVRWEDGRESTFYPGSDATIRHHARRPAASRES
jgi:Domain of unknown function (DUF1918)